MLRTGRKMKRLVTCFICHIKRTSKQRKMSRTNTASSDPTCTWKISLSRHKICNIFLIDMLIGSIYQFATLGSMHSIPMVWRIMGMVFPEPLLWKFHCGCGITSIWCDLDCDEWTIEVSVSSLNEEDRGVYFGASSGLGDGELGHFDLLIMGKWYER